MEGDIANSLRTLTQIVHPELIEGTIKNPHYLDYISSRGRKTLPCQLTLHPGKTCPQYWTIRVSSSLKMALKVQLFAILLPALIFKRKQLKSNFKATMRKILIKFAQGTFFVTMAPSTSFLGMCI